MGGGLFLFVAFDFTHWKRAKLHGEKPKILLSLKSKTCTCMMTIQQQCQTLAYSPTTELQLSAQPVKSMDTLTSTTTTTATNNLAPESVLPVIHDPSLLDHPEQDDSSPTLLVVSPYRSRPHLLSLPSLDPSQQLLAKALTTLQPIRADYATCAYHLAFNWSTVTDTLRSLARQASYPWPTQHFYIVVFRSQIPPTTNRADLAALDRASHVEATQSGGLLKYWFGVPDAVGRNVATCEPYSSDVPK